MMGRKFTPAERAALAARIVALRAEDPPLTFRVIAERCGVGQGFVAVVLREAKENR
jgi:hypothetical protein